MLIQRVNVLAVFACIIALGSTARPRARLIRPVEEDDQLSYRAEERSAGDQVVLVSADAYDNLYRATDRLDEEDYQAPRPLHHARQVLRQKEAPKQPPVQTIRNYNKVNDDGSFTFGYEAADGSFKEETRGTDCVVRGKYGYVDPDGNKREFTYVSGNPCDPNKPDEDEQDVADSNETEDEGPANYPTRAVTRPRPTTPRPTTTYFQNDFRDADEGEGEEEVEPLQNIRTRIAQRPRPAYPPQPIAITPRPLSPVTTARALPPATTFRPQLLQVTARPAISYSPQPTVTYSPSPSIPTTLRPAHLDFAAEFAKFQRENQVSSTASSEEKAPIRAGSGSSGNPLYSTELIYDPSSGQYNTQLYQTLPQTKGELNLNQRLQPFVSQAQPRPFVPSQQFSPSNQQQSAPLFRHQIQHGQQQLQQGQQGQQLQQIRAPQELYQRQQAENQYQNSAQLFAQQQQLQQSQLQRDRQIARQQAQRLGQSPQQFYYVAPRNDVQSTGQIDAFLRGHGIQF